MKRNSIMWLLGITLTGALFLLTSPYPQSPDYYLFADTRTLLSVPNFWNVVSNLPFMFIGIWGFAIVLELSRTLDSFELKNTYLVFFTGVFLTAFGSSYFHFEPGDSTLFWDRLPMTIAFSGLFAAVIGEYGSKVTAQRCLPLFLIIGIGSVLYWQWTESIGAGDLRPYAIVQFLPMLVVPAILVMNKGQNDIGRYIWLMIAFYVVAKILEQLDVGVYEGTQFMSGHALKHVAAAVGPAVLAVGLSRRIPRQTNDTAAS